MEPLFIAVAFACGMLVNLVGLPPLIGFLAAGFVLNGLGYQSSEVLTTVAELGVTLMLFTIGLKLNIKTLLRRDVWGTATVHILLSSGLFWVILLACKGVGMTLMQDLEWPHAIMLGFALSFSSTVFAVKVLEDRSDMNALYAKLAIGVLIMQDIFAVGFLTASTGKLPSIWALWILALPFLRPLLFKLLERAGHGELQMLMGITLALVLGAAAFEAVGLKPDLGALVIGMLLASHPAAAGMAKSLFSLKEAVPHLLFPLHRPQRHADPGNHVDGTGADAGTAAQKRPLLSGLQRCPAAGANRVALDAGSHQLL